jgi:hypothetical protein
MCPLLQRREAVYVPRFFKEVVGLCDHRTVVEARALLRETLATKLQVLNFWPQYPNNRNRYPLALCTKSWQRLAFADQHAKGYGGRPDNKCFSMTFYLACYATFVHKCDVNFAKAVGERSQKHLDGHGNTTIQKVMEPVAYQEQLDGLVHLFGIVVIGPKWGDNDAVQTVRLVKVTWVLLSGLWTAAENAIQVHSCLASQR